MVWVSKNLSDTQKIAADFAKTLTGQGEVVAFTGGMGSGKTTFISFLVKELGCATTASSPTFTIQNIYKGKFIINHFDMYRITDVDSFFLTGYYDFAGVDGTATFIEWSENVADFIEPPDFTIKVTIDGEDRIYEIIKRNGRI